MITVVCGWATKTIALSVEFKLEVNLFHGTYFLLCLIDHHTDVDSLSPDVVHMVPGPIMPLSLHQHIPGWFPGILLLCHCRLPYMTLSTEYLQVIHTHSVEIEMLFSWKGMLLSHFNKGTDQFIFNSLRPIDAYMHQWTNHHWFR